MVSAEFTALVTKLRDAYLAANEDEDESEREFELAEDLEALPVGTVDYLIFLLHPNGNLLAYNLFFSETTTFSDEDTLVYGLRLGSHRYPELTQLFEPRPADATECRTCSGAGEYGEDGETPRPCSMCHGRGWLHRGVLELIELTATELRAAGEDREATTLATERFVDRAAAVCSVWSMLSHFGSAMRIAEYFEGEQQEWRQNILGNVANRKLKGTWPHPYESDDPDETEDDG
jgi:hypothetical protein